MSVGLLIVYHFDCSSPGRVFLFHYCLGLILVLHKLIHFSYYFHSPSGTLGFHLCKLKPPFLNSCTEFCLIYLTSSRLLPPVTRSSTYKSFSTILINSLKLSL